jgi:hypothetical protein
MEDEIVDTDQIEQVELVEYLLEELGNALVDTLSGELNALNEPLAEERAEQAAKAWTLRESHEQLKPRIEAQVRILAGEIDKALAEGRDADAEAKRQEGAELQSNLGNILSQAEACERRVQEREAEQQRNYRVVFESAYPKIRHGIISAEIALATLLDKVWDSILRFDAESGLPSHGQSLVKTKHFIDLTPYESGPEGRYFASLRKWFGGGR